MSKDIYTVRIQGAWYSIVFSVTELCNTSQCQAETKWSITFSKTVVNLTKCRTVDNWTVRKCWHKIDKNESERDILYLIIIWKIWLMKQWKHRWQLTRYNQYLWLTELKLLPALMWQMVILWNKDCFEKKTHFFRNKLILNHLVLMLFSSFVLFFFVCVCAPCINLKANVCNALPSYSKNLTYSINNAPRMFLGMMKVLFPQFRLKMFKLSWQKMIEVKNKPQDHLLQNSKNLTYFINNDPRMFLGIDESAFPTIFS